MEKQEKLIYRKLNLHNEEDKKLMNQLLLFDTTKDCFGDYDFYKISNEYESYAIYIKNEPMGYLGFRYINSIYYSEKGKYYITICIRKDYQSKGLGNVILNQILTTLFDFYGAKCIYVEVVEDNEKCNRLVKNNHFKKDGENEFLKNGNYVKAIRYSYTMDEYRNNKKY